MAFIITHPTEGTLVQNKWIGKDLKEITVYNWNTGMVPENALRFASKQDADEFVSKHHFWGHIVNVVTA